MPVPAEDSASALHGTLSEEKAVVLKFVHTLEYLVVVMAPPYANMAKTFYLVRQCYYLVEDSFVSLNL